MLNSKLKKTMEYLKETTSLDLWQIYTFLMRRNLWGTTRVYLNTLPATYSKDFIEVRRKLTHYDFKNLKLNVVEVVRDWVGITYDSTLYQPLNEEVQKLWKDVLGELDINWWECFILVKQLGNQQEVGYPIQTPLNKNKAQYQFFEYYTFNSIDPFLHEEVYTGLNMELLWDDFVSITKYHRHILTK